MIIQTNKELPKRREYDFYPTPLPFAIAALRGLPEEFAPWRVLDPGAGTGVWGEAAWSIYGELAIMGYELRKECAKPKEYDIWRHKNYPKNIVYWENRFDLVMGNPPYRIAEEFIRGGLSQLRPGGYLVFMLRLAFLESKRRLSLWNDHPLKKVVVCANRPSFTGDGKTNATAYAFYYWKKGYKGGTELEWKYILDEIDE